VSDKVIKVDEQDVKRQPDIIFKVLPEGITVAEIGQGVFRCHHFERFINLGQFLIRPPKLAVRLQKLFICLPQLTAGFVPVLLQDPDTDQVDQHAP
jgi:hypothetical protein